MTEATHSQSEGVISTALRIRGSVVPCVLQRPLIWVLSFVNVATMASVKFGYFDPDAIHVELHPHASSMLSTLTAFFLVFYNGHAYKRYNRLHNLSKDMSESCIELASMLMRSGPDKQVSRRLVRMLLGSTFLFYFEITPDASSDAVGDVSPLEWNMLRSLNLLTNSEIQHLHTHRAQMREQGFPSYLILHWSLMLLEKHAEPPRRFQELERKYNILRKYQAEVLGLMELPVPFEYFHLLNFMIMIDLIFLAYSMGLSDSWLTIVIFFVVQLVFLGMRELSVQLLDPFGIDEVDFPVSIWMTVVYNRVVTIMNDNWEEWDDSSAAVIKRNEPARLELLPYGRSVVDLLEEVPTLNSTGPAKSKSWMLAHSQATSGIQTAGGIYQQLPTDDSPW